MQVQQERVPIEGLFERVFKGNPRAARENRVREYIIHRIRQGASLGDVLQEEYVRRNCDRDELNEVVRDPRLIHEAREELRLLFTDGRLDPEMALRRR